MRYLSKAVDNFDLIDGMNRRGEAAMDAKNLVVDNYAQGEKIEHISEIMPNICVAVFAGALGIEAIGLRYAPGFMVSPNQVHTMRVSQFETNKQRNSFDAEQSTVNIVACKFVSGMTLLEVRE